MSAAAWFGMGLFFTLWMFGSWRAAHWRGKYIVSQAVADERGRHVDRLWDDRREARERRLTQIQDERAMLRERLS